MAIKHSLIANRFDEIFGGQEIFLFPMDWGAAQEVNTMYEEGHIQKAGLLVIRYDIPLHGYGGGRYRYWERTPEQIRNHLERGVTWTVDRQGQYEARQITPVNFDIQRVAVPIEDWSEYTNQGLLAGVELCIIGRDTLNLKDIYPAGFTLPVLDRRNVPPRYKGYFRHLITPEKARSYLVDPLGTAEEYLTASKV